MLTLGTAALADDPIWDVEDPCVADNEGFIGGTGYIGGTFLDGGVAAPQSGAQPWPYYKIPNEGYSLYRDDVTNSGNLDQVYFLTFTPDIIDLPIIASYGPYTAEEVGHEGLQVDYPYEGLAEYWHMGGEVSPDTWYWSLEPRGYNYPAPPPAPPPPPPHIPQVIDGPGCWFGKLAVSICGNWQGFAWADEISLATYYTGQPPEGKTLAEEVVATGCGYELVIPAGTVMTGIGDVHLSYISIKKAAYPEDRLIIGPSNMSLSNPATLYLDGEEVMSFTRVIAGKAS
ncbi:unnamed protein product [marine sediment metagenome]|uniref:Uncharacterized protein n=1 Tax=marine sediment metagenome TaxID=412755 RepID=X1RWL8_9ZZZZ